MLIEATNVFALNTSELISVNNTFNSKFQIIILTYLFEYSDASAYMDTIFLKNWNYELEMGSGDAVAAFSDDFGTSYDVRTDINYIWFEKVNVTGSTISVSGHSFHEGVEMDLQYGIVDDDTKVPVYQDSNTFTDVSNGEWYVYIRDQRGVGCGFPSNPIILG
jgi:hypothetical protein